MAARSTIAWWRWRGRILAVMLLAMALAGGWGWWQATGWRPDRQDFPSQGVLLGEADGTPTPAALRALGADFVYIEASQGAEGRDRLFAENLARLSGAGLPLGVVHRYDPCRPADEQAANFVTTVPRDETMLPAAIALDGQDQGCPDPVAEAAVESELTTFINQVENHTGVPVVLLLGAQFEARYHIAARIERNLWVEGSWRQPDYAGRPWTLWTANAHLRASGFDGPLRWVVVQP